MCRDKVQSFSEEIASYLLLRADAAELPVDLERVARFLGVKEIQRKAIAAEGYVEPVNDSGFRIVLKLGRSEQRTRFSLAHEIGHVVLHRIRGSADGLLGRRYRNSSIVQPGTGEEAIADALAGSILLPPAVVSRVIPRRFSMRGIVSLADTAMASIPTAMLRAMWYATQPCFAFHLRWFAERPTSLRCLWVHSSRSFREIGSDLALSLLCPDRLLGLLKQSSRVRFLEDLRPEGPISHVQVCRSRFYERESLYGIAFLKTGWEESLFNAAEVDFTESPVLATSPDSTND